MLAPGRRADESGTAMTLRPILFSVIVSLALAPAAHAIVTRSETKEFEVKPGCTLRFDTYRGSIEIQPWAENRIRIELQLEYATDKEETADRLRKNLHLDQKLKDGDVVFRATNPSETGVNFTWSDHTKVDIAYKISVPAACNLDVLTRNGATLVGNLRGRVKVRGDQGPISLRQIDGTVDARTETGDIVLSRCTGTATLRTLRGNVRAGLIAGYAKLTTDSGEIEIQSARGGIEAICAAGDVSAGFPKDTAAAAKLLAEGGNVNVKLDPEANVNIHASTTWGKVRTAMPFTVEQGEIGGMLFIAKLNHGGPKLTLRAEGGHVKIEPGTTFFD